MVRELPPLPPELAQAPRVIRDIAQRVQGYSFRTIMDVGANLGQSCLPMAPVLPQTRIYAFEPAARTFAKLKANVAGHRNIEPLNLALGAVSERSTMSAEGTSLTNRLMMSGAEAAPERPSLAQALGRAPGGPPAAPMPAPLQKSAQEVEIVTGADFCRKRGIDHVSFLKIDTEGHDLEVVRGFGQMLQIVDFLQVEAAMNDYNQTHVPLRDFQSVLTHAGFYLFHIYGEAFEFKRGGRPVSRRCNAVFIHGHLVGDMEGIH